MATTPVKFYATAIAPVTMSSSKHHLQYKFCGTRLLPTNLGCNDALKDIHSTMAGERGPDQTGQLAMD